MNVKQIHEALSAALELVRNDHHYSDQPIERQLAAAVAILEVEYDFTPQPDGEGYDGEDDATDEQWFGLDMENEGAKPFMITEECFEEL